MGVYIDWSAIQCCGEYLVLCPQSVEGCCGFWIGKQSKDEIITSPEFLGTKELSYASHPSAPPKAISHAALFRLVASLEPHQPTLVH
jgi:hypothetical protein